MPTPPYSPARIEISIPSASYDGQFWGRYPQGDKPSGLTGPAAVAVSAAGTLRVGTRFTGAASVSSSATGILTTAGTPGKIKRFMGHWIYIDQGVSKDSQFSRTQQLVGLIPEVVGYQYLWKWADLESPTTPGNYSGDWAAPGQAGFSLVHRFADYLRSVGKKMHLNNFSYGGNGGDASVTPPVDPRFFLSDQMPTYLSGSAYGRNTASVDGIYGGLWMESFKQSYTRIRSFMRYWDPAVGARLLALSQAYGREFDSHAGFGMFSPLSESTVPSQMATYSLGADKGFFLGPSGAFVQMRAHWPTTPLRFWANFIGSRQDMSDMHNAAVANKWLLAGPDLLNDYSDVIDAGSGTRNVDSDWVWKGKDTNNVVNPNYTNWVNRGAFGHDVEPLDLDNSHDDANNVHHLLHANKTGAMALFWYDLRYNSNGTTPPRNRTDTTSGPNLLDQIRSSARGGVSVNGITIPRLTNDNLYPPTW